MINIGRVVILCMNVALQLFAYDEGYDRVYDTMDMWADQYTDHHIDYFGCVTPKPGGMTVDAVLDHPDYELIETPKGKVSSRNYAHDMVMEYDVIVTTDADAPPLSDDTLYNLLYPYRDVDVVATNANVSSPGIFGLAVNTLGRVEDAARPHMHGQCSSFTTDAWEVCGPFDESVDQTNVGDVRSVEEFGFYSDLDMLGKVIYCHDAPVFNDTRRVYCKFDSTPFVEPKHEWCQRIGVDTFDVDEEP